MPNYIWLVLGETGEYSDYTTWIVSGFLTEELAKQFRDSCQNEADKVGKNSYYKFRTNFEHRFDSQFVCDYNGTKYYVQMVELLGQLPEVIPSAVLD